MIHQTKKRHIPILLLIISCMSLSIGLLFYNLAYSVDIPFPTTHIVEVGFSGARSLYAADIDGDGDPDIAGAATDGNEIAWWENINGDGSAWQKFTVDNNFGTAYSVWVADVDDDGDFDLLGAARTGNEIVWWENVNGDGSIWAANTIDDTFAGAVSVSVGDIDQDGDLDALGAAFEADEIAWWENSSGNGTTWVAHTITGTFDGAHSVHAADVDGDGDLDVVGTAANAQTLAWWENADGAGGSWLGHQITNTYAYAITAVSQDIDRDGDLDILVAARDGNRVAWWENTAVNGSVWVEHVVSNGVAGASWVEAADYDQDGDIDVLAAASQSSDIIWWENSDSVGLGWLTHTITTTLQGTAVALSHDMDMDGDLDILAAAQLDDRVAWWENQTIHRNALFVKEIVIDAAFEQGWTLAASDIDGDGDLDIAGAGRGPNDEIAWWRNDDGDGLSWTKFVLDSNFADAISVDVADIDGDGDQDIAGTANVADLVAWWENTSGNGSTWAYHVIASGFTEAGSVVVADMDGDGDQDALAKSFALDDVVWWENNNGSGTSWTAHMIDNNFQQPGHVRAADIDLDGDLDVVGAARQDDDVTWWENVNGDGLIWTEHLIDGAYDGASTPAAVDFDRDGDIDIVATALDSDQIAWWENMNGLGTLWTKYVIATGFEGASQLVATDMDADGDVDVVAAARSSGEVAWWENDGSSPPAFTQHTIREDFTGVVAVLVADLDGDGDQDVAAPGRGTLDTIAWWPNLGGQFSLPTTSTTPITMTTGTLDDVLQVVAVHNGRVGDHDAELVTFELLLEETAADPLTNQEANNLIKDLRIYRDDGSGVFEPGSDILVTTVSTLTLTNGIQTVAFSDGDANVQFTFGLPVTYFVTIKLTPQAVLQMPNSFWITHLTDSDFPPVSTAEDRDFDIPLSLAYTPVVSAFVTITGTVSDLSLSKSVDPDFALPSQLLTYTLAFMNDGPNIASGTIITDLIPNDILSPAYTSSGAVITATGGVPFVWQVADLAPGEGGVITITGIINPDLMSETLIVNTAVISNSFDITPTNNTDMAVTQVLLPQINLNPADYVVNEDAGVVTVTAVLSPAQPFLDVTVDYQTMVDTALAGVDYTAVSGTLTFPAGTTTAQFTVPILDDVLVEPTEIFHLSLSNPVHALMGNVTAGTVTIIDEDELPLVSLSGEEYLVPEDIGQATITVTLDHAYPEPVSVAFATANGTALAGADYTAVSGTLTFTVGITQTIFMIAITDDMIVEPSETFTVTLFNPTHATLAIAAATVTILDNDQAPPEANRIYLPFIARADEDPPEPDFPIFINTAIAPRPVVMQGEVFFTATIMIPADLPATGQFFLSSQPNQLSAISVDDELVLLHDSSEVFARRFSTDGQTIHPELVELPRTLLAALVGESITVLYRDVFSENVSATAVWLLHIP